VTRYSGLGADFDIRSKIEANSSGFLADREANSAIADLVGCVPQFNF